MTWNCDLKRKARIKSQPWSLSSPSFSGDSKTTNFTRCSKIIFRNWQLFLGLEHSEKMNFGIEIFISSTLRLDIQIESKVQITSSWSLIFTALPLKIKLYTQFFISFRNVQTHFTMDFVFMMRKSDVSSLESSVWRRKSFKISSLPGRFPFFTFCSKFVAVNETKK